jgi:hypothetical protein
MDIEQSIKQLETKFLLSLVELDKVEKVFDDLSQAIDDREMVLKIASQNKLTDDVLKTLNKYPYFQDIANGYRPINSDTQHIVSQSVKQRLEEGSTEFLGSVFSKIKSATGTVISKAGGVFFKLLNVIFVLVTIYSGIDKFIAWLVKSIKYLEILHAKIAEGITNKKLEAAQLKNIVFTPDDSKVIYTAEAFKTSIGNIASMFRSILAIKEGRDVPDEDIAKVAKEMGYILKNTTYVIDPEYNCFVKAGKTFNAYGWTLERIVSSNESLISMNSTIKEFESLMADLKKQHDTFKAMDDKFKKGEAVESNGKSPNDIKQDLIKYKKSLSMMSKVVKVYTNEVRHLLQSAIALSKLTIKVMD